MLFYIMVISPTFFYMLLYAVVIHLDFQLLVGTILFIDKDQLLFNRTNIFLMDLVLQ